MVFARESLEAEDLRRALLEEVARQGLDYGLVVESIQGGFTQTGRSAPNSFQVTPDYAWKVHLDGRPDELVRGVDLIGTPLMAFERILAAGDDVAVFNGRCGAESGWVPVSASSPSLLLGEVEFQKKEKGHQLPPILPPQVPVERTDAWLDVDCSLPSVLCFCGLLGDGCSRRRG